MSASLPFFAIPYGQRRRTGLGRYTEEGADRCMVIRKALPPTTPTTLPARVQKEDTYVGWHRGHLGQHGVGRGTVRTRLWIRPGHATFLGQRRAGHLEGKRRVRGEPGACECCSWLVVTVGGREDLRAGISVL